MLSRSLAVVASLVVVLSWQVAAAAQTPAARRVTLELSDVPVSRLVPALASQLHEPVVIDADAQSAARCAHVTVSTGGPQAADRVVALVSDALRSAGLSVARDANGIRVRHVAGTPLPPGCLDAAPAAGDDRSADPTIISSGIRTRPDGTIGITPAARDAILADQAMLMTSARVIPQLENGVVVGVRLFGIRAGTFLALLGFQNGDTVRLVNGFSVSSPEQALEVYARLRAADHLDVDITRAGAPRTIHLVLDAPPPPPPAHHGH